MFVAVCLVAANMRMTIMGIGPLLESIAEDQGVSPAALGMLASVPLLSWAIVSPLAHDISARVGMSTTVSWSLILLTLGTIWRSLPGSSVGLWAGTALIGIALAIGNVLMPALIKREFTARLALVMGVYTALMSGMGSVGAGMVVPLAQLELEGDALGWRFALLCTGFLIPFALIIWIIAHRKPARTGDATLSPEAAALHVQPPAVGSAGRRIWGDRLAWLVALYMGLQSAIFYMLSTWLAPHEVSIGYSDLEAGFHVMLLQLYGIVGSLLTPLLFRGRLGRWSPLFVPLVVGGSAMALVLMPALLPLWLVVCGIGCGSSLSVAIMLMALRARTSDTAAALSGMSQSVGYGLAAIGPPAFGLLHDMTGGWLMPFLLVAIAAVCQATLGFRLGRGGYVLDGPEVSSPVAGVR